MKGFAYGLRSWPPLPTNVFFRKRNSYGEIDCESGKEQRAILEAALLAVQGETDV